MEVVPPKIIEEGEIPKAQTSPDMKKNVALGALAGLILSAGIIVLMTVTDDTIKSEEDVYKRQEYGRLYGAGRDGYDRAEL